MEINGNLYIVSRKEEIYPELGYNDMLVCARSENEAKGIALNAGLFDENEKKREVIIKQIHEVNPGDILLKG